MHARLVASWLIYELFIYNIYKTANTYREIKAIIFNYRYGGTDVKQMLNCWTLKGLPLKGQGPLSVSFSCPVGRLVFGRFHSEIPTWFSRQFAQC